MDKKKYLDILKEQIRCKKAIPGIAKEIEAHIEDQKQDYLTAGMTEREAEEAAVLEMGDPVAVGVEMDRIHRPKMDWKMIGLVAVLYLAGLIFRYLLYARCRMGIYVANTWIYYLLGFLAMIGICYLDYSRIGERARELTVGLFLLLAVGIYAGGTMINGSSVYISMLGFAMMNIKVLVLLFVPLYGAILYRFRGEGYQAVGKALLWMLPMLMILWFSREIMQAFFLSIVCLILLIYAVCSGWYCVKKKWTVCGLTALGVGMPVLCGGVIWKFAAVYQRERVRALLPPYASEISGKMELFRNAVSESEFTGRSARAMEQLESYGDMDYMLAYIMSFYGILVAVILIGLIALLFFRLAQNTVRQKNQLGRIMGMGCILILAGQFLLSVLGNLGLQPYGEVYCPFLSVGGSGALMTGVLLGILFSIYRYQNVVTEAESRKRIKKRAEG